MMIYLGRLDREEYDKIVSESTTMIKDEVALTLEISHVGRLRDLGLMDLSPLNSDDKILVAYKVASKTLYNMIDAYWVNAQDIDKIVPD